MGLRINDTIPDLTVETDQGTLSLHDWIGDSWAILFSHPKDFTPVCTTEFGAVALTGRRMGQTGHQGHGHFRGWRCRPREVEEGHCHRRGR